MIIDMIRTFHPVGQGAFYSERFHGKDEGVDFCIVYDCGTKTSKEKVNPATVIQDAFEDSTPIDILFISHFDEDHVSMIEKLANRRRIKRVVLPLLPVEETVVLQAYYHQTGNSIGERLLTDPIGFFEKETAVLYVDQAGNESVEPLNSSVEVDRAFSTDTDVVVLTPNGDQLDAEPRGCIKIPSGTMIFVPCHTWCYIPHNYKYSERHDALMNELSKRTDIDLTRLGEASYLVSKRIELNEVYKSLQTIKCGNINENSMLVYSGPPQYRSAKLHAWGGCWSYCGFFWWHEDRSACIYSGDSDFNKVRIHRVYGSHWKNVGTVQIPHHGSAGSFSAGFLGNGTSCYLCPISAGQQNQHGHPAPTVLKNIQIRHSLPLIVDECPCSKLMQHLWIY